MIPVSHAALCGLAHAQQQTEFCVRQIFATGGPEPGFTAQSLPEAAVFGEDTMFALGEGISKLGLQIRTLLYVAPRATLVECHLK